MARFCTECGGSVADQTQKFCVSCGGELPAGPMPDKEEKRPKPPAAELAASDELYTEFPELRKLEKVASAREAFLYILSVPGYIFFAWVFWGEIDWLSLILIGLAAFFFIMAFYSRWKFHTYKTTLLQMQILVRVLRNPSIADAPQKGSA